MSPWLELFGQHSGNPLGALLVFGAGALGVVSGGLSEAGAYSYLFASQKRYGLITDQTDV